MLEKLVYDKHNYIYEFYNWPLRIFTPPSFCATFFHRRYSHSAIPLTMTR